MSYNFPASQSVSNYNYEYEWFNLSKMNDYSAHQEIVYSVSQNIIIIPTEHTLFAISCAMQAQFLHRLSKIHFNCYSILFFITQAVSHQTAFEKYLYLFLD
jgi:hypothetical protein